MPPHASVSLRDHLAYLPLPPFTDFIQAKLSVRMTAGPDFVATDFGFYNCHRYQHCSQCVSSQFPCDWCVDGHRCTHDTAENCRNDILITGVEVRADSGTLVYQHPSC